MDPVTSWLGEWVTVSLAGALFSNVKAKLDSKDLEKALKIATLASRDKAENLFFSCTPDGPKGVKKFLENFFGTGAGFEELQKPLAHGLKPDADVLVKAFQAQAQQNSEMQNCRSEYLQPWLDSFAESYFEQTSTFIRYEVTREKYLERLITSCEDVKFVGIDVSAREDHRAARLLDIFVVPNVSEESTKSAFSSDRLLLERPEQLTERQAELWLEQRDRHAQERGRSMSAHEMLRATSRQRVVLLGDPGTGKTTLMRYLAVMSAGEKESEIGLPEGVERLPILVYMRDWAKHPERSLLDQVRDFAENTLQVELPSGFLEHWMEGQALLLLDGLDEVAEDSTRAALVEKINCFLAAHENNWAVITSRPWGYRRDYFRTDAYPHFELELFDEAQVQEFIEHWYENRCDNAAQAQEMIRDLQDALKSKDRLQNLVRNPLLLTMVALIHRYQDTLPKRRYKLYDRAVDTLLKSWDRKGKGETYGEFKHLDRDDDLRRVMSQLAYWIHTQYETQSTESGTVIEEADLLNQLSQIIRQEYPLVKPHQAAEEAERFVTFIRDRTGLLNEYGRGCYAFVHKTFQEYLTAEAILNQAKYDDDPKIILQTLRDYLHNPHWREVLLLLVGQRQGKGAANAIEEILRQDSPYEQWLHRDLLFAGRCLTEDPEKLATAAPTTISEILQKLVALEAENAELIGNKVKQETFEILSWLKETAFGAEALANLKSVHKEIDQWQFLTLQAKLGEKEIAITTLLQRLQKPDTLTRYLAASTLENLGDRSELVMNRLLQLLQDSDLAVCCSAASTLVSLGNHSELVVNKLLQFLQDSDLGVRMNAASAFIRLGDHSELVMNRLLQLLQDSDDIVFCLAASALVKLGDFLEATVNRLLDLLQDPKLGLRGLAVSTLIRLGDCSETVVNRLLYLLRDPNAKVRHSAAFALGGLRNYSEATVNGLLQLLRDPNAEVRSSAASALGRLGDRSEAAVNGLIQLLQDPEVEVRSSAAFALGRLGDRSEVAVDGLIQLLQDPEAEVLSSAVSALGHLGDRSEALVNGLHKLLEAPDLKLYSRAASTLGKLGKSDSAVQSNLVQWIEQHSDLPNLGSAIDALWQICA
jgi:HEAT repeat protein/GTPase SAR1 family protein